MKKNIFLFIVLSYFLYAQETNYLPNLPDDLPSSILESDDYKLAQRYKDMAIEAHENGDYNQSIEFANQSKEYSDKILTRYGIYQYVLESQKNANRKLVLFKGVGGDTNDITIDLYNSSVEDINYANDIFEVSSNGDDYTNAIIKYDESADKSELGYNVIAIDLRREYLIGESVLTNGDNNDINIVSLRDEATDYIQNSDYNNALNKSRNAMDILDQIEAPLFYAKAQEAMEKAKNDGYDQSKSDLYSEASKSLYSANESLLENNNSESLMHSKNVINLVTLIYVNINENMEVNVDFPKYYVVESKSKNTDSLWNIASYDFIYGDGNLWRKIYDANKDKIKDPNIIVAGQILFIPSLKGEIRDGTYDPNITYGDINNFTTSVNNNEEEVEITTVEVVEIEDNTIIDNNEVIEDEIIEDYDTNENVD